MHIWVWDHTRLCFTIWWLMMIKNRLRAMDFSHIRYSARENVLGIDKSQSRSDWIHFYVHIIYNIDQKNVVILGGGCITGAGPNLWLESLNDKYTIHVHCIHIIFSWTTVLINNHPECKYCVNNWKKYLKFSFSTNAHKTVLKFS